jgi:hypothetical protein
MDKPILNQIADLVIKVGTLDDKITDTSTNVEEKDPTPYSKANVDKNPLIIADVLARTDGYIAWNDSELNMPPIGVSALDIIPTKGYNKHFHNRYAGGALDLNSLEIVEFDIDWETDASHSEFAQQFWADDPPIAQDQNSANENVDKIGGLDLVFDADAKKWGASAYEIDIAKCYFVQRDPTTGEILLDENGNEMKAKIYNSDDSLTSIIWDKDNQVWRFFAIYKE